MTDTKDILIPETGEHLRRYIVRILDDIRGDNDFPTDKIVQANASILYTTVQRVVQEYCLQERSALKEFLKKEKELLTDMNKKYYSTHHKGNDWVIPQIIAVNNLLNSLEVKEK